jgi:hypothetical protein
MCTFSVHTWTLKVHDEHWNISSFDVHEPGSNVECNISLLSSCYCCSWCYGSLLFVDEWNCTSSTTLCVHGVNRDSFTFTFTNCYSVFCVSRSTSLRWPSRRARRYVSSQIIWGNFSVLQCLRTALIHGTFWSSMELFFGQRLNFIAK